MEKEAVSSYGIIKGVPTETSNLYRVEDMVEKPAVEEAPSRTAVLGRYVITPDIFPILEQTQDVYKRQDKRPHHQLKKVKSEQEYDQLF